MHLIAIVVSDLDAELVSDRCWQSGAAGILQSDDDRWLVGVEGDDLAAFLHATADLSPVDVTETEALVLTSRDVTVEREIAPIRLHVPPTVFGDGNHPTTATTLDLLATAVHADDLVLDVGCGTGVLAIEAARLGAQVTAIDIDPDAVDATAKNAAANQVSVSASATPLHAVTGAYDVVVANITAGSIAPLLGDLVARTRPGGTLIVSGILDDQWEGVAAQVGGNVIDHRSVEGWVSASVRL